MQIVHLKLSERQPLNFPQTNSSSNILEAQQLLPLPICPRRLKTDRQTSHTPLQGLFRPICAVLDDTIHNEQRIFFKFVLHVRGQLALMLTLCACLAKDVADEGFEFGQWPAGMFAVVGHDVEKCFFVPEWDVLVEAY
jgi:hypothetical protein